MSAVMRSLTIVILLILSGLANAKGPVKKINFSEPPFWMASFEEFSDLRKAQKELYLNGLLSQINKTKGLRQVNQSEILAASKKSADWEKLMTLIYEFCGEVKNKKTCFEIAQVRIKTLEAYGNDRLENRTQEH